VFRRCQRSLLVGKRHRTMRHVPSFNSRQTADGTCADHRCSRVQRRREGPTVVPTPAFRDFQSLCCGAGLPRGAYAPRSWLYMRLCIAKVAISPAHVRACNQERRASARRGYRYRTCDGASTNSRQTADGACAVRRCSSGQAYHGGLTPPALVLRCERLPAKKRFLRCTNAHPQERRTSARRGERVFAGANLPDRGHCPESPRPKRR
jgi:hypothetical protein